MTFFYPQDNGGYLEKLATVQVTQRRTREQVKERPSTGHPWTAALPGTVQLEGFRGAAENGQTLD